MSVKENVLGLNAMLLGDQAEQALAKYYTGDAIRKTLASMKLDADPDATRAQAWGTYYADDMVRRVPEQLPYVGKEAARKQESDFLAGVTKWGKTEIRAVGVDEENQVSMVEWYIEYTHKQFGDIRQCQVSVHRWRDGRIYEETIYVMWLRQ
jgi:hypothetical protein